MGTTSHPTDPGLHNIRPDGQQHTYLVLSPEERAKGFTRPIRRTYTHTCGAATTMSQTLAETYARDPRFYGATYCVGCRTHYPINEFRWDDGTTLGT